MNEDGFKKFLGNCKSEKTIKRSIAIVREVETFLKDKCKTHDFGKIDISDFRDVVQYFFENKKNTRENYLTLLRYSRFVGNQELEIALLELLDGSEVLKRLSDKVKKKVGEKKHSKIFEGIELPQLGTFPLKSPKQPRNLWKEWIIF